MYCQKCGIQNADDASFCYKCGDDIGKQKSIPIEKTTAEQLSQTKAKKEQSTLGSVLRLLRWIFGIFFGLYGIVGIILYPFGVGTPLILISIVISIVILPKNKSIAGKSKSPSENKSEYKNIDLRELDKNYSKFIDQKIKIYGTVNWIEEKDGNTFLSISAHLFGNRSETILIDSIGSTSIVMGQNVVVFGVVKGKSGVYPLIFATSIKLNSSIF